MQSSSLVVSLVLGLGACAAPSRSGPAVLAHLSSGFIAVEGGRVWYEVHGKGHGTPLLVLHGGPGIPHDYLQNLDRLGDERPVVFYDQLGCGKSDRPEDPSLWTVERFAREVDTVRRALGLDEVVLYGHSWGSLLAVEYMAGHGSPGPNGVKGLILAGPALSIPRWIEDANRLVATLPQDAQDAIHEGERTGNTEGEAYQGAMQLFYSRYVCRLDPWPDPVVHALETMGAEVYGTMNGPSEFTVVGTLKDHDVTAKLRQITVRTLLISGEFDEAPPATVREYAQFLRAPEVAVIPGAAHLANHDQPEAYMRALRGWMSRWKL